MKRLIKGNHAVALAAKACRVGVVSAYPITPQTTIVELLAEMCASGELPARFIKVESENSAISVLVGASTAGVRSFTATSSHGLLYMHEVLHWAAGARLPVVMVNVNRAVGAGWNIWADQTDSISQRETGWIQIYAESNQEAADAVILAFALAERISMPAVVNYDAFFLSHTAEVVDLPEEGQVDDFLPPFRPPCRIDFDDPRMFGGLMSPECYFEHRVKMHRDILSAVHLYSGLCKRFEEVFGRSYSAVSTHMCEDAEIVVITFGTLASAARNAVDMMRAGGIRAGMIKVNLFVPLDSGTIAAACRNAQKVVVVDRNLGPGRGGALAKDLMADLCNNRRRPVIFPVVAGLGGRDVTRGDIFQLLEKVAVSGETSPGTVFWGLKEGE